MYQAFYRLSGDPFRLSPDHAFCYRYPSFAKGRAYMQYALQAAEGFVVITGAPGMGKTTLINDLLSDYGPSDYLVATLVNTLLEANDILRSAAYEFGVSAEGLDTATLLQRLKQLFTRCHQERRPPLLVVDEAQNLAFHALEELRMLTNLQYQGKPLLQIFLVGQEGLREKLQDPRLEQLRQRVTAAAHLHPLNQEQTAAYILHRLKVVGWQNLPRIKASVLPVIETACQGVPRRINQFCSRLLLHGAVEERTELGGKDAQMVFQELADERLSSRPPSTSGLDASANEGANGDGGAAIAALDAPAASDASAAKGVPGQGIPPPAMEPLDPPGPVEEISGDDAVTVFKELPDDVLDEASARGVRRNGSTFFEPLDADSETSPAEPSETIFEQAESMLREQRKDVLPPPGKPAATGRAAAAPAPPGEPLVAPPALHPDRSGPVARSHLRDPEFERFEADLPPPSGPAPVASPAGEPDNLQPSLPPGERGPGREPPPGGAEPRFELRPERPLRAVRRRQRLPLVAVAVLLLLLLGAGIFGWYRLDPDGPLRGLSQGPEGAPSSAREAVREPPGR